MSARIALGDARDPRVIGAAAVLAATEPEAPVLVGGDAADVPRGVAHVPADDSRALDVLAELVGSGEAAAGIAGSTSTSASVVRAALRRLRPPGALVSACFAIRGDGAWSTYADCVVNPEPSASQLATIAADAADHHRRLFGIEPKVALLSFSTHGSADHPRVDMVREATRLLRERRPEIAVDGELQFDVAVDPDVAKVKAPESPVAGAANVLVFPTLDAGNIAYKVAERVGRARAVGSFVLGLTRPWVDLSRGCSIQDIIDTARLVSAATSDGMSLDGSGRLSGSSSMRNQESERVS